eukprot:jgi/Picsp_1/6085/NSC_03439-R1_sister chromatid cohesion protein
MSVDGREGSLGGSIDKRVILHIDLDCFYCQVEHRRLNIPRDCPLAVQQWDGLIAVNYPARTRGIQRHMRAREAKIHCPDLRLVHVETIGTDRTDVAAVAAGTQFVSSMGNRTMQPNKNAEKACLERYRLASAEILDVIRKEIPSTTIEKASIDEVYVDVTSLVDVEMEKRGCSTEERAETAVFSWGSIVVGGCSLRSTICNHQRLALGAMIASRIRGAILAQTTFTCSAGIANNKLLSKVGSAKNKPNQQTLILPESVPALMGDLPIRKLRSFGGKVGEELELMGCQHASDVKKFSFQMLSSKFGHEKARWILNAVNGNDSEPVREKKKPKSMLAAKSFQPTRDLDAIEGWFAILASELASRLQADEKMYNRKPRTLSVYYRSFHEDADVDQPLGEKSRQTPMPSMPASGACKEIISQAACELFMKRCISEAMPCSRLAIAASDFVDSPEESHSITKYFLKQKNQNNEDDYIPKSVTVSCQRAEDADIPIPPACSDLPLEGPLEREDETKKIRAVSKGITLPEGISDIDIEEQKRIFKEVSMLHNLKTDKKMSRGKRVQVKTRCPERKRDIAGILKYFDKK